MVQAAALALRVQLHSRHGDQLHRDVAEEDFHVYAIEWRPDRLDFLVDKTNYFTFKNEGKGVDESIFPQRMYIDYMRVYQEQNPPPARPLGK